MNAKLEQELSDLKQGDHICLIYENAAEQLATVVLFIIEGLARGERCVYIIDDPNIEDSVVQMLTTAGVDVVHERQRGSLRFLTSQTAYLRDGEFSPLSMLNLIRRMEIDALADGFSGLRLTAEPTWSFGSEPGCDRLIEYEALLNQLPTVSKSVLLCQYHRSRFGVPCIHDVLRTHPVAILGDQVCPNPYYEPPEIVLSSEPQASAEYKRKRVAWWIAQFKRARVAEQERERALTAQHESEGRFREIVDLIPAAVYVCDKYGVIQQFNKRAVELWGRVPRPDEDVRFCGAIQHFRMDGSVIPRDELPIVETIHYGTPVRNQEVVIERADGSRVVVMVNIAPIRNAEGTPVGAINCFLDVTERRQAEERLRQSERRLAEAQQVAHIGSWERDLRTNQVIWSDELYRLFGVQSNEIDLSYQQFLKRLVPQDVDRTRTLVDAAIRERRPFSFDYRITRTDGSIRVLHDQGGVILNEEGEPIRLVGTCQDVTELRQTEQALQEYSTRLQTLSRRLLEVQENERRHLARELHDEFGQILATITLHLHAARGLAGDAALPRLDECATLLQQAGEQVRSLALELRPTMLDTLGLEATLRWLAEQHQQRTACEVQVVGHLSGTSPAPELAIACFRVAQEALTNVARHAAARHVWIELSQSANMLVLIVRDDGAGFEAASTQEQAATGGRLGLLGMRERVEIFGGSLDVDSEPGRGTRIRASFPVTEAGEEPSDPME